MNAAGVIIFRIFSENVISLLAFDKIFLKFLTHASLWESTANILVFTVNFPLLGMDKEQISSFGRRITKTKKIKDYEELNRAAAARKKNLKRKLQNCSSCGSKKQGKTIFFA